MHIPCAFDVNLIRSSGIVVNTKKTNKQTNKKEMVFDKLQLRKDSRNCFNTPIGHHKDADA